MGTFYENQLKRMFGESELLSADTIFSGKAMISKIGEDLRAKVEFVTARVSGQYEGLKTSIINRKEGVVDSHTVMFHEVIGLKGASRDRKPHVWDDNGKAQWFGFTPTGIRIRGNCLQGRRLYRYVCRPRADRKSRHENGRNVTMALVFSKVTIDNDGESIEFLVSGSPRNENGLKGWVAYEDFIKTHEGMTTAQIQPYSYGSAQPYKATPEEVAYMDMRWKNQPNFLETRCTAGVPRTINITGGGGLCVSGEQAEKEITQEL